jgi:hypothetical protein
MICFRVYSTVQFLMGPNGPPAQRRKTLSDRHRKTLLCGTNRKKKKKALNAIITHTRPNARLTQLCRSAAPRDILLARLCHLPPLSLSLLSLLLFLITATCLAATYTHICTQHSFLGREFPPLITVVFATFWCVCAFAAARLFSLGAFVCLFSLSFFSSFDFFASYAPPLV